MATAPTGISVARKADSELEVEVVVSEDDYYYQRLSFAISWVHGSIWAEVKESKRWLTISL